MASAALQLCQPRGSCPGTPSPASPEPAEEEPAQSTAPSRPSAISWLSHRLGLAPARDLMSTSPGLEGSTPPWVTPSIWLLSGTVPCTSAQLFLSV